MDQSQSPLPIDNATSSVWSYIFSTYLVAVIVYVCLSVLLLYFFLNQISIIVVVLIGSYGYSFIYRKIKGQFTQEFGQSIGFTYEKSIGLESVSGKLFAVGHSQSVFDVLSGVYHDTAMRIFSFQFTVGYGRDSHTYCYTVTEATLAGNVPDIFLYSKEHQGISVDFLAGNETVELEGDFNAYFKLRVPKGYEQEAYQIFTPDVMASLIDKARGVSFEFVGNKLYIYATKVILKREEMQEMFDLSQFLVGLFRKNVGEVTG